MGVGSDMSVGTNMSDDKLDVLCEDCGQAFSDFLHEMADQNAKVTTCPKCGKIHEFPSKAAKPRVPSLKKVI
jgi:RNase P subunit RPR2